MQKRNVFMEFLLVGMLRLDTFSELQHVPRHISHHQLSHELTEWKIKARPNPDTKFFFIIFPPRHRQKLSSHKEREFIIHMLHKANNRTAQNCPHLGVAAVNETLLTPEMIRRKFFDDFRAKL